MPRVAPSHVPVPTSSPRKWLLAAWDRKLGQIEKDCAAGHRRAAVFDIDNTLADTRYRTLAIARDFDRRYGTDFFSRLTVEKVGHGGADTAERMGVSPEWTKRFDRFWFAEFWNTDNWKFDSPMGEVVSL